MTTNLPTDQRTDDPHRLRVGGQSISSQPPMPTTFTQWHNGGWLELRLWAELYERAQQERIAASNIIRDPMKGGNVDPAFFEQHLERLAVTEHEAGLLLKRCYRRVVPAELIAWQRASTGIGEHSFARILGHLGDPCIATPHAWEGTGAARKLVAAAPYLRSVSQLRQYAGHGRPGRPAKGATAEDLFALGSPKLKMLVHLQAEFAIKERDRDVKLLLIGEQKPAGATWIYRGVYEQVRVDSIDKVHTTLCLRCGPAGKPAVEGSPWNLGHQHAHALRIVGKTILRDIWRVRRAVLLPVDHRTNDTHARDVNG